MKTKYDKQLTAFRDYLQDLRMNLELAIEERDGHTAQFKAFEEAWEESMLSTSEAQAKAHDDLQALIAAIEAADMRIATIKATLSIKRESPTLQRLAQQFWDACAKERSDLMQQVPAAMEELEQAQKDYLKVVSKTGSLGTAISRCDALMNKAASPFLKDPAYQPIFQLPPIFLGNEQVLKAYDPTRTLAPPINPDALKRPMPNADTVLEILKEEK